MLQSKKLLILSFFLFVLSNCFGQVIEIQDSFTSVEIDAFAKVFEDLDTAINIKKIQYADSLGAFVAAPKDGIMYNYEIMNDLWVRFDVKNTTADSKETVLNIDDSKANLIQLFTINDKGNVVNCSPLTGDYMPFSTHSIPYPTFSFPIKLAPHGYNRFYIYASNRGEGYYLHTRLFTTLAFAQFTMQSELKNGVFCGIWLIMMTLYSSLLVLERNKMMLSFWFYQLSVVGLYFALQGLGNQYVWYNFPAFAPCAIGFFQIMHVMALLKTFDYFANVEQYSPRSHKLLNILAFLMFLFIFSLIFHRQLTTEFKSFLLNIAGIMSIVTPISIYAISYKLYTRYKVKKALYFCLSISTTAAIVFVGYVIHMIAPGKFDFLGNLTIGFFVDLLFFSIVLTYDSYTIRDEHQIQKIEIAETRQTALENLITGQQAERQRIAQRLHDGMSLLMASIKMRFSSAVSKLDPSLYEAHFQPILTDLGFASQEIRNISHDLDPTSIHTGKLIEAIEDTLSRTRFFNPDLVLSLNTEGFDESRLSHPTRTACFYIVQELIYNAVKYADCAKINIVLTTEPTQMTLTVSDNGTGYDPSVANKGFGLRSIQSRVSLLQGAFEICRNTEGGMRHYLTLQI
jgi:two-component system, sensor histidine kinase LadS